MMTVRFPSGFSVQYNDAHFISRIDGIARLYDKEGGKLLAYVPMATAIIECVSPCRLYDAIPQSEKLAFPELEKKVGALTRAVNKLRKGGGQ